MKIKKYIPLKKIIRTQIGIILYAEQARLFLLSQQIAPEVEYKWREGRIVVNLFVTESSVTTLTGTVESLDSGHQERMN